MLWFKDKKMCHVRLFEIWNQERLWWYIKPSLSFILGLSFPMMIYLSAQKGVLNWGNTKRSTTIFLISLKQQFGQFKAQNVFINVVYISFVKSKNEPDASFSFFFKAFQFSTLSHLFMSKTNRMKKERIGLLIV